MGLAVVALVGAVAVGLLTGGTWQRLAGLRLRGVGLAVTAALAQLAGGLLARATDVRAWYAVGLAVSAAAALGCCLLNRRVAGIPLVTAGLAANALVVAVNGGTMPVSSTAAVRAGVPVAGIASGSDPRHEVAGPATPLRPLGDVLPVPWPWRPEVVSAGDVLVAAGLAELVVVAMHRRRRSRQAQRSRVAWSGPTPKNSSREDPWRRRSARSAPAPRTRPTTASAPTPETRAPH